MSRYAEHEGLDDAPVMAGDARFVGVDGSLSPQLLEEGFCAAAVNIQFHEGRAQTRPTFLTLSWGLDRTLELPADFLLAAAIRGTEDEGAGYQLPNFYTGTKVTDRGIKEFLFVPLSTGNRMRSASRPGPSEGDVVRVFGFQYQPEYEGTYPVTYAGDDSLRVLPPDDVWNAASVGGSLGNLFLEGTVAFDVQHGFGSVRGATVFSDPNGTEGVVLAMDEQARLLRSGQAPQSIGYPDGVRLDGDVRFVQAFDRVFMFRGVEARPLVWVPQEDFSGGVGRFEEIAVGEGSASFLEAIPNGVDGVEFSGRLFVQYGRDQIAVSDVYDYTVFDPVLQAFRINEGSDDSMVRIMPFGRTRLLVFFDQSVWVLDGVFGDLSEVRGDVLTKERGAIARDAIVQMGPDVWFLSEGGVYALSQMQEGSLQAGARAISAQVQPLFDRINWPVASQAQAVSAGGRFYLAVPMDGALYNNALLVFDQKSGQWWGHWEADFLDVRRLLRTTHAGRRGLVVVNGAGGGVARYGGVLLGLADDAADRVCGDLMEVQSRVLTRGFAFASLTPARAQELMVLTAGNACRFAVRTLVEGVNKEQALTEMVEPDRRKYRIFGKADYDVRNLGDDHGDAYREDYSVVLPAVQRARCAARVTPDAEDLEVILFLARDYAQFTYGVSISYALGDLPEVLPGDAIETRGFLAEEMNRNWVVSRVESDGSAVCAVTAAEKAAIVAECDGVYDLDAGEMWYAMKDDPSDIPVAIRSWAFGNVLARDAFEAGSGFDPDAMQVVARRLRMRQAGVWVQAEVVNVAGRLAVMGVSCGGRGGRRRYGERM